MTVATALLKKSIELTLWHLGLIAAACDNALQVRILPEVQKP